MTGQQPAMHVPVPSTEGLIQFAAETRPDWDSSNLRAVLLHAHTIGMTWAQVLATMGRLMADQRAVPGELVPDWRDPVAAAHRVGADPAKHADELADARAAIAAASAKRRTTDRQVAERAQGGERP